MLCPLLFGSLQAMVPSGKGTNAVSGDVTFSPDGSHILFTGDVNSEAVAA